MVRGFQSSFSDELPWWRVKEWKVHSDKLIVRQGYWSRISFNLCFALIPFDQVIILCHPWLITCTLFSFSFFYLLTITLHSYSNRYPSFTINRVSKCQFYWSKVGYVSWRNENSWSSALFMLGWISIGWSWWNYLYYCWNLVTFSTFLSRYRLIPKTCRIYP